MSANRQPTVSGAAGSVRTDSIRLERNIEELYGLDAESQKNKSVDIVILGLIQRQTFEIPATSKEIEDILIEKSQIKEKSIDSNSRKCKGTMIWMTNSIFFRCTKEYDNFEDLKELM